MLTTTTTTAPTPAPALSTPTATYFELLVFGYIRTNTNITISTSTSSASFLRIALPIVIYELILAFYPQLMKYDGVFEEKNMSSYTHIVSKYAIKGNHSSKLSIGMPVIHSTDNKQKIRIRSRNPETVYHLCEFNFKLVNTSNSSATELTDIGSKEWYFMGVVSNRCKSFSLCAGHGGLLADAYGVTANAHRVVENNAIVSTTGGSNAQPFTYNEVIYIEYRAHTGQLLFKRKRKRARTHKRVFLSVGSEDGGRSNGNNNNNTDSSDTENEDDTDADTAGAATAMDVFCRMQLPMDNKEITHWFPAAGACLGVDSFSIIEQTR